MAQKNSPKTDARDAASNVIEFPQSRFTITGAHKPMATMGFVNLHELTSLRALTSYVAHNKNVPEDVVRAYLQAEFNIKDMAQLRRDDFERAIKFLVDLRCDLMIH